MKNKLVLLSGVPVIFFIVFLLQVSPAIADEGPQQAKKEYLTVEELLKTKASQLFVTRRYAEALEEFRALENQYPKDIVVKRYIGACLDHLRRDEEAIAAFQEVLKLNPNDLPSRQFIAKIYVRMGNLDKAEEEFTFIINNDKRGTFTPFARAQLANIKRLKETATQMIQAPGRQITPQQFLQTKAAQHFMNAKYKESLEELEGLESQYPQDVLIKRYKGLVLDKLGRFDEALLAFDSGLKVAPENLSLHYSKAQTFLHKRDYEGSAKEFKYVVEHDETGAYKARAQAELTAVQRIIDFLKAGKPKKWTFNASGGAEYDTNAASESRVVANRSLADESGWKWSNGLGGNYEILKKGNLSSKVNYSYSQSIYSDSLSQLNTFGNTGGINFTYILPRKGKQPIILQASHSSAHTMVREKFYSAAWNQNFTAIYSPLDWLRVTLSDKWGYTTYDSDGSSKDDTKRDGFNNTASITNNFYVNKERTYYYVLGLEYAKDVPEGINYKKAVWSLRLGWHLPLYYKWEGDLSFKFKDSDYRDYGFPADGKDRRDEEYTFGVTLSKPLNKYWSVNANYNFTDTVSKNDAFTYINHALGVTLSYNY